MALFLKSRRATLVTLLGALVMAVFAAPNAAAAAPRIDESRTDPQAAASKGSAYRAKQDDAMREATARDLSDPFLGASWADLGW